MYTDKRIWSDDLMLFVTEYTISSTV